MSEITTVQNLTPEVVKGKLQIALTKVEQSVQALNDAEGNLVYNEDNLAEIKNFIENCKKAEKIVDDERKALKEPFLQGGRAVDDGAKLLTNDLAAVKQKALTQYTKLCQEVERKRQEAELEKQRVVAIRNQMDNFKIEYSSKIADAKTSKELVDLERRINLETANKNRYQEFLPEFTEGCKAIRSLLRDQKEKVREMEELERRSKEAAVNGSDEQILDIMEQKEALEAKIAEKRVLIQTEATNQASQPTESAEIILPIISSRQYWKWEMTSEKEATKAGLTLVTPNKEKIDEILKQKREEGKECVENGIRYFVERKY